MRRSVVLSAFSRHQGSVFVPHPFIRLALACTAISLASTPPAHGALPPNLYGRWSKVDSIKWNGPANQQQTGATHMIVLRGNGDSTRVLYFHDHQDPRLWLWNLNADTLSPSVKVPDSLDRVFCAGHVITRDGRALVVGGTTSGETGSGHVNLFDPLNYAANGYGWARQDTLKFGRWYPGATLLGNGKTLVTSGENHANMLVFGGYDASGRRNDMRPMALKERAVWNTAPIAGSAPAAREGQVAVYHPDKAWMLVYGGLNASGNSLGDLWLLTRTDTDVQEEWRWTAVTDSVDPGCNCRPGTRADHSAVLIGDTLVVYGGRQVTNGMTGIVYSDTVWQINVANLGLSNTGVRWKRLSPQGTGPGARFDHVVAMDPGQCLGADPPGPCTQANPVPQLIVHGGRNSDTSFADSTVWALPLARVGTPSPPALQWSSIATGGPTRRAGHSAVRNPSRTSGYTTACNDKPRISIVFFGGQDATSPRNDTWELTRTDTLPTRGAEPWQWRQFVAGRGTADSTTRPPKRTNHSAMFDGEFTRMVVFGGDTTGTGGRVNDVWSLSFGYSFNCPSLPGWTLVRNDSTPTARKGHTAVFEEGLVFARIPELFATPKVGQQPQSATVDSAYKRLSIYPHFYLLKSGKLFHTGNVDSAGAGPSYILDLGAQSHPWQTPRNSGFIGGASAMFRPDSVMKSGGWNPGRTATQTTKWIPAAILTEPWKSSVLMDMHVARANHNLTILPTGQVLATGGTDAAGTPWYQPEIWTRAPGDDGTWGSLLAPDYYIRGYHSTAALLPDARVLVSGGPPVSDIKATIFWPPYLFADASGTLRSQTQITASCALDAPIHYGETFRIDYTPATDTIGSVCLIRSTATTHQYNMSQRYLPLSIASGTGRGNGYVTVTAPADSNEAPAGDHMLFIVRADGTPSKAKWLRLENDLMAPAAAALDEPAGGPNSIILSWGAPGDDDFVGRATAYDLRYSTTFPIDETNFYSALQWGTGAPKCSGEIEIVTISANPCMVYYFGIKVRDEVGNWSPLSTTAVATRCGGFGPLAGLGSGGGSSAEMAVESAAALPVAASESVSGGSEEGSVLSPALPGDPATDRLVLRGAAGQSAVEARLVQLAGATATLDAVRLLAVDHLPGEEVFSTSQGVLAGKRRAIARAWRPSGLDLAAALSQGEGAGIKFRAGDTVFVALGAPSTGLLRGGFVVEAMAGSRTASGSAGISVEGLEDTTRTTIVSRAGFSESGVRTSADSVRLIFAGPHWVQRISAVDRSAVAPVVFASAVSAAVHSRLGDVTMALSADDTSATVLAPGDTLRLAFAPGPVPLALSRDCVLVLRGKTTLTPGGAESFSSRPEADPPRQFALLQNLPNPFSRTTTIRFDLPAAVETRLEIFDLAGRRLRTLASGGFKPGRYAVEWDRTDSRGRRMPPGIYLYRFMAGGFSAKKRMVLVP